MQEAELASVAEEPTIEEATVAEDEPTTTTTEEEEAAAAIAEFTSLIPTLCN